MYIIYACEHIRYNLFLRDLFINLDRYYYKHATTVFILKNVCFSADSCCTDKTKPMNIIHACKLIGYYYLQHFLKSPFYIF